MQLPPWKIFQNQIDNTFFSFRQLLNKRIYSWVQYESNVSWMAKDIYLCAGVVLNINVFQSKCILLMGLYRSGPKKYLPSLWILSTSSIIISIHLKEYLYLSLSKYYIPKLSVHLFSLIFDFYSFLCLSLTAIYCFVSSLITFNLLLGLH